MKTALHNSVLELPLGQILRLSGAAGRTITCEGGTLWVTQEGRLRDDFLSAGQTLCIASAGTTLVEAVGGAPARLTLHARCAPERTVAAFQARTAY
jgi:Protein of unknown function (DUF2917)